MGTLSFSTLTGNVERNIGNRTDLTTQVQAAVNQAYLDVITMRVPRPNGAGFLEPIKYCYNLMTSGTITVATSNASFALTSVSGISDADTVLAIYALRDTTNKKILEGPKQYRDLLEIDVTVTGDPTQYARYGNTIYFNRTTDASTAYTLYYYKRPTALSGSTATVIPIEFDYAIELRATRIMLETPLHETDHAAEYDSRLMNWLLERVSPEVLAAEDADFGLEITRSGRSNTARATRGSWKRGRW